MSGDDAGSPPTADAALRSRLPRLEREGARALRELFSSPGEARVRRGDQHSRWRLLPPRGGGTEWVALDASSGRIWISIRADHWLADIGPLSWRDHEGEARLLAWALAHEELLAHLETWLGEALRPAIIAERPEAGGHIALTWSALRAQPAAPAPARGGLLLPHAALRALLESECWQTAVPGRDALRRLALDARLDISLGVPPIGGNQLRAFREGDVMVVGGAQRCWQALELSVRGRRLWRGRYLGDGRIRVAATRSLPPDAGAVAMSANDERPAADQAPPPEPAAGEDAAAPAGTDGGTDLGALPVRLSLDLGNVEMPMSELGALQPGYVFELGEPLDGAPVTLRANDRVIGRGELVLIGDELGVRLTSLQRDGSR